jgi:uncharacterized NAD(P)/FAD-binding protein YdhS
LGRRIGIIGGGASGTLVAANLLWKSRQPVEIFLIDPSGSFGPGVPYRTENPMHRLNVPAARMSALDDNRDHFLEWMRQRDPETTGDAYPSRGIYGEYLKGLLAKAESERDPGTNLNRVTGTVTEVRPTDQGATLLLKDSSIEVDHAVIATGPIEGADPVTVPDELRERGIYVPNAWDEAAVLPARADAEVLIIGTGLTMVDAALTLSTGANGPRIRAVSRSGLVPKSHLTGLTLVEKPDLRLDGPPRIQHLMAAFSSEFARASQAGGGWRDAIDSLRLVTGEVWRELPTEDKQWFMTNLNRVWEVHRYRMAPEVGSRFDELLSAGRVTVSANRIGAIETAGSRARVSLVSEPGTEVAEFDRVISACGAGTDVRRDAPAPIPGLIESGHLRPDDINLGLDVDRDGAAIERSGRRSDLFSTLGSLRRGVEWETIGMIKLRWQSAAIADRLLEAPLADRPKTEC